MRRDNWYFYVTDLYMLQSVAWYVSWLPPLDHQFGYILLVNSDNSSIKGDLMKLGMTKVKECTLLLPYYNYYYHHYYRYYLFTNTSTTIVTDAATSIDFIT